MHFNNKQMKTLSTILIGDGKEKTDKANNISHEILEQAEGACPAVDESPGAMEFVYYLRIPVPFFLGESEDHEAKTHQDDELTAPSSVGDLIAENLCGNEIERKIDENL